MNGLLFLTSDDFYVNETQNGRLLNSHISEGMCLILFYSTQCVHCQKAIPVIKSLPQLIHGCTFGMINVSTNAKVVHLSRTTLSPIQYVPYMILYINGEPAYKYKGSITIQEIQKFIFNISQQVQPKQKFIETIDKDEKKIPEFTTGIPYCDENFCYLDFEVAYPKKS